jgi:hypothetical protein
MQTDREKTIEKLWQNSGHGTRWADVAAAYDAGVAAERIRWQEPTRMDCASCEHVGSKQFGVCTGCEREVTVHANYKRASWA